MCVQTTKQVKHKWDGIWDKTHANKIIISIYGAPTIDGELCSAYMIIQLLMPLQHVYKIDTLC